MINAEYFKGKTSNSNKEQNEELFNLDNVLILDSLYQLSESLESKDSTQETK